MECQREKRKFENQRSCLRRCIMKNAAATSGVMHSSSVVHENVEEEIRKLKELGIL